MRNKSRSVFFANLFTNLDRVEREWVRIKIKHGAPFSTFSPWRHNPVILHCFWLTDFPVTKSSILLDSKYTLDKSGFYGDEYLALAHLAIIKVCAIMNKKGIVSTIHISHCH